MRRIPEVAGGLCVLEREHSNRTYAAVLEVFARLVADGGVTGRVGDRVTERVVVAGARQARVHRGRERRVRPLVVEVVGRGSGENGALVVVRRLCASREVASLGPGECCRSKREGVRVRPRRHVRVPCFCGSSTHLAWGSRCTTTSQRTSCRRARARA